MSVTATNATSGPFAGTGAQTAFPYTFKAITADEVQVLVDGVAQVAGYTVTLGTDGNGGTVTFAAAPANGAEILLGSLPSFEQDIAFTDSGPFLADTVDLALDRGAVRDIYLREKADRSILAPLGEAGFELPSADDRANFYLAFDADGNPVTSSGTGADAGLRTDLALSSGTSLLAFTPATGLSALNLQTALRLLLSVTPFHFGCVGDGVTNDLVALQAFNDWYFGTPTLPKDIYADYTGNFGISGTFNWGPATAAAPNGKRFNVGGELRLIQLTATFKTCVQRNFNTITFRGGLTLQGIGSQSFASRTCGVGLSVESTSGVSRILGGVKAYNFWYAGVHVDGGTINDSIYFGTVRCFDVGSGHSAGSLTATYSSVSNNGVSGSISQTTTVSGVSAFPAATLTTYAALGDNAVQVRINGYLYYVTAMDSVAGTITIFPWIDPATATSGSLDWCIGGAVVTHGQDGNIAIFDHIQANRCGRGLVDGGLYGSRVSSTNFAGCGTGIVIGRRPDGAHIGSSIDGFYVESTTEQVAIIHRWSGNNYSYINSAYALDLAKVWAVGDARVTAGTLGGEGGSLGTGNSSTSNGYLAIIAGGVRHAYQGRSIVNALTTAATFSDQSRPPRVYTQNVNTQTVTLSVQGAGEYNRLFGYRGGIWRYVGTGTNGAPTGTMTFAPPTQTYTNCVKNGTAVVTMASTAGLVAGMPITGTGIPAATTILSVDTTLQITLSAAATDSLTSTLTVTGSINGTFANVAFSGFIGVADFSIHHTDAAQLVWNVRCVTGQAATPQIQAVTSSATVTPTFSNDQVNVTAQAAALALANPSGTAVDGKLIRIRIKDNGTARAISYGTQYRALGVTLPTTTVISKTVYLTGIWNATDTKLDVTHVAQEA
jgi:hypothetical protein